MATGVDPIEGNLKVIQQNYAKSTSALSESIKYGVRRADESKLREIFDKYASVDKSGEKFMTYEDFIVKYLNLIPQVDDPVSKKTIKLLGGILDTSKDGLISFIEFSAFEAVLCHPDALYRTAFQVGVYLPFCTL